MECVLEVLRGELTQAGTTMANWPEAFYVAEQEHVLPYFVARLRSSGVILPDSVVVEIAKTERETAVNSFWWTSELKGILQAFDDQALPVISLKGPLMAQRLYGGVALRISRDLDLLVRRTDLRAARALLTELGFSVAGRPDDYQHSYRRGTTLVELHYDVENPLAFNFDVAAAWRRAIVYEFAGQPVWRFCAADELLFLCLHGVRHRFQRLSHTLDIALALHHLSPEIAPDFFFSGAPARLRSLIVLGRAMALTLDPKCDWSPEIKVDARAVAHLHRVADRLWMSLMNRPGTPLNWQAQHCFYVETEPSLAGRICRRLRHTRILATRLIEPDFAFANRFGIRAVGLVWVLRQVRLIGRSLRFYERQAA